MGEFSPGPSVGVPGDWAIGQIRDDRFSIFHRVGTGLWGASIVTIRNGQAGASIHTRTTDQSLEQILALIPAQATHLQNPNNVVVNASNVPRTFATRIVPPGRAIRRNGTGNSASAFVLCNDTFITGSPGPGLVMGSISTMWAGQWSRTVDLGFPAAMVIFSGFVTIGTPEVPFIGILDNDCPYTPRHVKGGNAIVGEMNWWDDSQTSFTITRGGNTGSMFDIKYTAFRK